MPRRRTGCQFRPSSPFPFLTYRWVVCSEVSDRPRPRARPDYPSPLHPLSRRRRDLRYPPRVPRLARVPFEKTEQQAHREGPDRDHPLEPGLLGRLRVVRGGPQGHPHANYIAPTVQPGAGGEGEPRPNALRKSVARPVDLRGLLRCGKCEYSVTTETQKGHLYYPCTKRATRGPRCSRPYVREEDLEAQVSALLPAYAHRSDWAEQMLPRVACVTAAAPHPPARRSHLCHPATARLAPPPPIVGPTVSPSTQFARIWTKTGLGGRPKSFDFRWATTRSAAAAPIPMGF